MKGHCEGCNQRVEIDVPPDAHCVAEHHPRCTGYECDRECPVPAQCGPVVAEAK
jgi:hypothetical protein